MSRFDSIQSCTRPHDQPFIGTKKHLRWSYLPPPTLSSVYSTLFSERLTCVSG
jgi:hypothetical protein